MLQITPATRILVAIAPIDFRNGIDGLVRICRETLVEDPFRGDESPHSKSVSACWNLSWRSSLIGLSLRTT